MSIETEPLSPPKPPGNIAPLDAPPPPKPPTPPLAPEPFISEAAIYKLKHPRIDPNMHFKCKPVDATSVELFRMDTEYSKVKMSNADFSEFYVKV